MGSKYLKKKSIYVTLRGLKTTKIMSQDKLVKIKCQETGEIKYTRKNRKTTERKLELKKYNSKLRKHTIYKEVKK